MQYYHPEVTQKGTWGLLYDPAQTVGRFDLGVIERDEHEARLTPLYAMACRALAARDKVPVMLIDSGEYSARHKVAAFYAQNAPFTRWLYVACHLNAGGGNYGLVIHDSRSQAGRLAAESIRAELRSLPGLTRALSGASGIGDVTLRLTQSTPEHFAVHGTD
jgi:hypothetical protein